MSSDEGRKRGETEREFAERCKRLIVEWWQQNAGITPDVKIVSVDGDGYAIRSNINGLYPRSR